MGKLKVLVKLTLLMGLLVLQYQNCSSYNDPSPFELQDPDDINIPPNKILLDEASDLGYLQSNPGQDTHFTIQADGACNVGLEASDHFIEFSLFRYDGMNETQILGPDAFCDVTNVNAACIRNVKCEHGRYHVLVGGQRALFCPNPGAFGTQLRLRGQLVLVDANGNENRPRNATMEKGFAFARLASVCN